ncbi:MAG TPA: hypothetical protein VGR74_21045 [Actinomycetota bacterium]|jgi:hypothetical protein|nr:hypothetical protein [Actinomycetota bacterium]
MRPARIISAVIFTAALAVTGCSVHSAAVHPTTAAPSAPAVAMPAAPVHPTANSPRLKLAPTPSAPATQRTPHFATPQASMRYLAAAYNRNDLASLMHVTTPAARNNLLLMRANATNLQLVSCTANAARGDYTCAFTHDFPVTSHRSGHGHAHFTVAPATRPGWYMTVLEDCD